MTMASSNTAQSLQDAIWNGSLPLEIRLSSSECRVFDQADPYLVRRFNPLPTQR